MVIGIGGVDGLDAEFSANLLEGLIPTIFPENSQNGLGVCAAAPSGARIVAQRLPASFEHHMFNGAQTDDHQGIGESGLSDTEAMHKDFLVALRADTEQDVP